MPPGPPGPYPPGAGPPGPYQPHRPGNRSAARIVIAVVIAFALVCGGALTAGGIWAFRSGLVTQAGGPGESTPSGPPAREGPVLWWTVQSSSTGLDALWRDLADEFAATGGEVTVETQQFDNLQPALDVALAAGTPPDLVYSTGGAQVRELAQAGQLRDITDDLADVIATLSPATLAPYTVDGRVYGLPYHMGMLGLWYNRALFAEAGLDPDRPPQTWEEFTSAVADLKDAGVTPIALAGAENWPASFWYSYLALRVAGDEGIAEAHRAQSFSDEPGLLRAAELLADLVAAEPFQPGFESSFYLGPDGQVGLFATGAAAMELTGSWAPGLHPLEGGDLGQDLGWFPFPAVEGGQGSAADVLGTGEGFLVTAGAPDTTLDLLRFLYAEQQYQRIVDAHGAAVPVVSGFTSPDPLAEAQRATIAQAPALRPPLDTDLPDGMRSVFIESVGQLVVGRLAPADVISEVTREYQRLPGG